MNRMNREQQLLLIEEITARAMFLKKFVEDKTIVLLPNDLFFINGDYYTIYGASIDVVEELPQDRGFIGSLAIIDDENRFKFAGLKEPLLKSAVKHLRKVCLRHGILVEREDDGK